MDEGVAFSNKSEGLADTHADDFFKSGPSPSYNGATANHGTSNVSELMKLIDEYSFFISDITLMIMICDKY